MADRTVKVRLEADISDFVTDIGVKAVAAVDKLEASAVRANKSIGHIGTDSKNIDALGTKADAAGMKLERAGVRAVAAGRMMGDSARTTGKNFDELAKSVDKVDAATADSSKTTRIATKDADAHANAVGRLRVAQLRLAEVQANPNSKASASAGAEEAVQAAERAVKKFEKAGNDSGRSFVTGLRKWLTGSGGASDVGKAGGTVFGSGFLGVLKTPILGPAVIAILTTAIVTAMPAVGAAASSALIAGLGAGLVVLGSVFAAKSVAVKNAWNRTLWSMGADMKVLSEPFEATLIQMAAIAKRTFLEFKPELTAAFRSLAPATSEFGDELGQAFEELAPAIQPLSMAFEAVEKSLGPAMVSALGDVSNGLQDLSASVENSPEGLADVVRGAGQLFKTLTDGLGVLNDINGAIDNFTGGFSAVDAVFSATNFVVGQVFGPFRTLKDAMSAVGIQARQTATDVNLSAQSARLWTQNYSQGAESTISFGGAAARSSPSVATLGSATAAASQKAAIAKVTVTQLAEAYDRQAAATQRAIDAMNRQANLLLALSGSEIGYQQAVDDATAAIKENGRTHDLNTQKGRDNQRALDQVAAAAIAQRDAMLKANDGNVKSAKAAEVGRAAYAKLAVQMGYSKAEAKRMAAEIIKIPKVTTAELKANITDLESKLATAKAKLKDPKLTATQKATLKAEIKNLQAGIASAKAALASVPASKTVSITVNTYKNLIETTTNRGLVASGQGVPRANGGIFNGLVQSYADGKLPDQAMIAPGKGGGMVQWAEAETGGEAFIPLAPSKRDRSEKILGQVANNFGMGLVKSFASGGFNLPGGRLVDVSLILRQLGLPFDPVAGVNYTSTLAAANRANRAVVPARANAIRVDRAEQAAKAQQAAISRAITLQQRAISATRAGKPTTKSGQAAEDRQVAAEQRKLIALQDKLYRAKLKTTAATKASNAADAVYKVRAEAAAKATAAHKDAIEKLVAQQQAAVDLAGQVSQGLTGGANIGDLFQQSLTGSGLLADLQGKGADLKKFGQLITQLRAKKLSEDLIQQIIGKGADQGNDLAQAILAGGLSMVNALNKAQKNLDDQANLIGAGSATAKYNVKVAGARAGGGDVAAGSTYRVNELGQEYFTAPINGHVIPAGQDPRRYIRSMAGGGGWGSGSVVREIHNHQHNTFNGMSMDEADRIAEKAQALAEFRARSY